MHGGVVMKTTSLVPEVRPRPDPEIDSHSPRVAENLAEREN
jgi:hypothetical protein